MTRRGSTGDDSDNDFSGGGYDNDTSAGSGVTGDSGSDTSYGGGGYDSGDSSPSAGDSGTDSSDFGGGGDSDFGGGGGDDDDDDYDPNPSNRETGTDRGLDDITGGRDYGEEQPQSTGDSPSRNQGGAGGSGTDSTSGDGVSVGDSGDDSSSVDVEVGDTSDRGVGVTRGPEGTEVVVPAEDPVQQSVREARQTRRAETRAAVNRFGQRQLDALRSSWAANRDGTTTRASSLAVGTGMSAGIARVSQGPAVQATQDGRAAQEDSFLGGLVQAAGQLQTGLGQSLGVGGGDRTSDAESIDEAGFFNDTKLYRESGLNTVVDAAFQRPQEIERMLGIPADKRDDTVQISGPGFKSTSAEGDGVFRSGESGKLNRDVTRSLTEGGGPLSEEQRRELRGDIEQRKEFFGVGQEADQFVTGVTGNQKAGNFARGVGQIPGEAAGATAGLTLAADTLINVGRNLPKTVQEHGAGPTAYNIMEVGGRATEATVEQAEQNPYQFAGSLVGSLVGGYAGGKALGKAGRFTKDRVRTAGGKKVDAEDLTNEGTLDYYEERSQNPEDQFPGAENPDLYETSPAEAVRRQAERYTPSPVEDFFRERGVTEGTTLKKAIEVEPEGPGTNRGPQKSPGFETQEGDYESPGAFAGPELSPNFLGLDSGYSGFSLRPGLPDFGNNPTGVLVRTDVREPDADTMDEFNRELVDERVGETTARTKPAGEVNTGEIEAVIPPEARFERVGNDIRGLAERFGLGSRFYTEIGGRRVPLRPVAPEGRTDADAGDVAPDSTGGRPSGETLDYYVESPGRPVDRPLPPAAPGAGASSSPQGGEQPRDPYGTGAVQDDLRDLYGDNRVTQDDRGPSSRGDSQRDRGRRSRPSDGRDTSRDRDSGRTSGDYRGPTDSGRSRVTESDRRITEPTPSGGSGGSGGGRSGGGSGGGGSSGRGSGGGGSSGGSPPSSETPPPSRGPPSTGPPSISEYITPPPSYNPPPPPTPTYGYPQTPTIPEITPRMDRRGDEDEEQQPFAIPFGFWDRSWVNPVASAQTAWTRTLGGAGQTQVTGLGTEEMLGAVKEDIQRYR